MTWDKSYLNPAIFTGSMANGTRVRLDSGYGNLKMAYFDNSVTPSPDTQPQAYGSGTWASGECFGANWPAGGVAVSLAGAGLTAQAGGFINLTMAPLLVANVTIADPAYGFIVYDPTLSGLVIGAFSFGGDAQVFTNSDAGVTPTAPGLYSVPVAA